MTLLAQIDTAIRNAEARHRSHVRASEIDLARSLLELEKLRELAIHTGQPAADDDTDWLGLSEIAKCRPAGTSTSLEAISKAIQRRAAKAPIVSMKRAGVTVWPRRWLENEGIIEGVSKNGQV